MALSTGSPQPYVFMLEHLRVSQPHSSSNLPSHMLGSQHVHCPKHCHQMQIMSAVHALFCLNLTDVGCMEQVELAALDYRSSRLVRTLGSKTGQRGGFGEGGTTEVVSAR